METVTDFIFLGSKITEDREEPGRGLQSILSQRVGHVGSDLARTHGMHAHCFVLDKKNNFNFHVPTISPSANNGTSFKNGLTPLFAVTL